MQRADKRKFHYIYKITRDDGRYYIGMHSTDDMEDGYFGSGKLLWYSIKKHGKERHSKQVLEYLTSREALKLRETELVNEELLGDPLCMNLKCGGEGNSSEDSKRIWEDPDTRQKILDGMARSWDNQARREASSKRAQDYWKDPLYAQKVLDSRKDWHPSDDHLKAVSEKNAAHHANRSIEDKADISKKISKACKEKNQNPEHRKKVSDGLKKPWESQEYRERMSLRNKGSIFVVNIDGCKGIKPEQLQEYLDLGYVRGRKLKG